MASIVVLPDEILDQILQFVKVETPPTKITEFYGRHQASHPWHRNQSSIWQVSASQWIVWDLKALRQTCHRIRGLVDPHFFQAISITKLCRSNTLRLQCITSSPWLPRVVKLFKLCPEIVTQRPVVRYRPEDYYFDLYNGHQEPETAALQQEHDKRVEGAKKFDEQLHTIWSNEQRSWSAAVRTLFQCVADPALPPYGSVLSRSVYCSSLSIFGMLTTLEVKFPGVNQETNDRSRMAMSSGICRAVNWDFSTAVGRYLATDPTALSTLTLRRIAPQHLALLVKTLREQWTFDRGNSANTEAHPAKCISSLQMLRLFLAHELCEEAEKLDSDLDSRAWFDVEGHESVGQLISFTPNLQALEIRFNHQSEAYSPREWLVLDHLKAPELPKLQEIILANLALSAEDLIRITVGYLRSSALPFDYSCRCTHIDFRNVLLLKDDRRYKFTSTAKLGELIPPRRKAAWSDVYLALSRRLMAKVRNVPPVDAVRERTRMFSDFRYLVRTESGYDIGEVSEDDITARQEWYRYQRRRFSDTANIEPSILAKPISWM